MQTQQDGGEGAEVTKKKRKVTAPISATFSFWGGFNLAAAADREGHIVTISVLSLY